jgi:hypothetical protein
MFKNRSLTILLALTAGSAGGFLSRCITPTFVYGQAQTPDTVEVRAQHFTIIDPQGHVVGTFTAPPLTKEAYGMFPQVKPPRIALLDARGRELWSAPAPVGRPLKTGSVE